MPDKMLRSLTRRDIKSPFLRDPNAGSPRTQEDSSLSKGIARPIGVGTLAANTRRNTTTFEQQLDPCRLDRLPPRGDAVGMR
jgi:hypothetical protein